MKILLDENIDIRFRKLFDHQLYETYTVRYMGWTGLKNGHLLEKMEANQFDVFIAVDKSLPYEQNQENLPVTIIIIDVTRNILSRLESMVPQILDILENLPSRCTWRRR